MCLAYFTGKGYSEAFTLHMGEMLDTFLHNPNVRLTVGPDEICRACPNRVLHCPTPDTEGTPSKDTNTPVFQTTYPRNCQYLGGSSQDAAFCEDEAVSCENKTTSCAKDSDNLCTSEEKVRRYDLAVLSICALSPGEVLPFLDFARTVQERILSAGKRPDICGDCQWNAICAAQPSRWGSI